MNQDTLAFVIARGPELRVEIAEHVFLTVVSTLAGIVIGVPLGVTACRFRRVRGLVLAAVGVIQTLPTVALLAFLLAVTGALGATPALLALALYALLPIVANTVAGIEGIPRPVVDAATGIGMTSWQRLWMVELRLALPVIAAGVRTAAVVGVGIATLAAFVGAGGLGRFINEGLALRNDRLLLLGAIPAAVLALVVDAALGEAARLLAGDRRRTPARRTSSLVRWIGRVSLVLVVLLTAGAIALRVPAARPGTGVRPVVVGSMNFTEQLVLGELMAQVLERAGHPVERRFNLGATMIAHEALVRGEIDVYPEYTGTALMAILDLPVDRDPVSVLATVRREYARLGCEWLDPYGFENTYVLSLPRAEAKRRGWTRISDLAASAGSLKGGFVAEFMERSDGFEGLCKAYGMRFGEARDLDTNLMYQALSAGEVDVICNYSTDGRILVFDLVALEDDRRYFPPYHAAAVARADALARPGVRAALASLSNRIDDRTMQTLNHAVDETHRSPAEVAAGFLDGK